jgi:CBS domain-containing protein
MPSSYQAPTRKTETKTTSQSLESNMAANSAQVKTILSSKGGEVFSIRPQETLGKAVEILRDRRIGALMVSDANGRLVGILSERDIVRKLADTPGQTLPQKVEDVMTKDVQTCAPDDSLVSVLRTMTDGRFRHMPVVDSDNSLCGMVTIGDVVNFRLTALEHEALQLKQLIVG